MRERPGAAIALGLLAGAAPFVFIAIGQRHVPAGLTGVLVASVPLWVAVLAFRVDRTERVDRRQALGLGIGFVGVSLVVGVEFVHTAAEAIGAAVILAGCVATGASTFVVKGQYGDMAPESRALIALLASTIMLLPVAVVSPPTELQWGPTLSVVVLAVVMTAAIMVLFHTLIMRIGSGRAALSAYLAPVFSLLAGNLLLGEPFTAGGIAGAVTIIAGVALASQPRRPLPVVLRPQPSAVSG